MSNISDEQIAELWAFEKSYSLSQAAALWINVCPPAGWFVEPDDPDFDIDQAPYLEIIPKTNEFERILDLLKKAVGNGETGELCADHFTPDNHRDEFGRLICSNWDAPHPDGTIICKSELLKWAKNHFNKLPLFLRTTEKETIRLNDDLNSILDKDHPFYSRELAAAIKAWRAMYINENGRNTKQGHTPQIKVYLENIYEKEFKCSQPAKGMMRYLTFIVNRSNKTNK